MNETNQARMVFTCTVRALAPAAAASLVGVAILAGVFATAGLLATVGGAVGLILTVVVVLLVGAFLASARLAITPEGIAVGLGSFGALRRVPLEDIAEWEITRVSWPQVFGIGLPLRPRTSRCLVRSGPALRADLRSGERLWVSLSDQATAERLLSQTLPTVNGARS